MHLYREKCLLFFFSFLMICSQIVSAQDKNLRQTSIEEPETPNLKVENPRSDFQSFSHLSDDNKADRSNWKQEKTELSEKTDKSGIKDNEYNFRAIKIDKKDLDFRSSTLRELKKYPFQQQTLSADSKNKAEDDDPKTVKNEGFNWRAAFSQSLIFLGVQHGYAFTQPKTRRSLKGKFWNDYVDSVKSLSGWDDGGRFFTNYIAHPMQGSLTGFIYVQNSPQARRQQFGMSGDYWRSRMKAMLWTTAWSTQFEIGPISQASIGNVGLSGKQTWEDIIVTPPLGTAMLITEDALDRYIIKSIERRTDNFYIKIFSRMLFNPTRVFANLLRFKEPWYRDRPTAH